MRRIRGAAVSPRAARLLGQRAALAGKRLSANPFIGGYAASWREGWAGVDETARGSEPEAATARPFVNDTARQGLQGCAGMGNAMSMLPLKLWWFAITGTLARMR